MAFPSLRCRFFYPVRLPCCLAALCPSYAFSHPPLGVTIGLLILWPLLPGRLSRLLFDSLSLNGFAFPFSSLRISFLFSPPVCSGRRAREKGGSFRSFVSQKKVRLHFGYTYYYLSIAIWFDLFICGDRVFSSPLFFSLFLDIALLSLRSG